jgi:hypothetical protein
MSPSASGYPTHRAVPGGMRAYRRAIRSAGPLWGLTPPALLGGLAFLLLRGSTSTVRGVGGFAAAVIAAPGLLAAGVPLSSGATTYLAAIAGSAVLWFVIGLIASRRATVSPVATWADFWKEYVWLFLAVVVGVLLALVAANLILGRALF